MSTFQELVEGIKDPKQHHDLRISLIKEIEKITERKLIVYAADFNKSHPAVPNSINQLDLTSFSDLIEKIDGDSIDILIHSPGGSAEATEQLVSMLRENYKDIRFIIPRMAKSAATMLALSGNKILMDDRSELGPTDPQIAMPLQNGIGIVFVPAKAIINGFNKAREIIETKGSDILPAYLPLLNKYDLHILEICEDAIKLSEELVKEWIAKYMFEGKKEKEELAKEISGHFLEHDDHKSHARPITISKAKEWKLDVEDMRENKNLRDKVWKLYCAIELFFDRSAAVKLYENAYGTSLMKNFPQPQVILQGPPSTGHPQPPQQKPQEK